MALSQGPSVLLSIQVKRILDRVAINCLGDKYKKNLDAWEKILECKSLEQGGPEIEGGRTEKKTP